VHTQAVKDDRAQVLEGLGEGRTQCFLFELAVIENNFSYASFSILMIVVPFLKTSLIKYS